MSNTNHLPDLQDHLSDPLVQARNHPLRASLSHEMHARKLPHFSAPARILQFVMLMDEWHAEQSLALLNARFPLAAEAASSSDRYRSIRVGDLGVCWERHTEFITYTFITEGQSAALFDLAPFSEALRWIAEIPGEIIRSSNVCLIKEEMPLQEDVAHSFSLDDLVISDVADGNARIYSDFRLHEDGFGRLLILDKGLVGGEPSQLVQRLQELGNYRKLALLGLPVAQQATPVLTELERRLTDITEEISQPDANVDTVLGKLTGLSTELAQIAMRTHYRMSATRAYASICFDRIRRLSVASVRGYGSLDDFTERRLLPAMRTCDAFSQRLDDLAQRVNWTSALLRTQVDTALARRNRDLLASMDRRTALQLRLQHTVEGLSVVAVSYYCLGLWHYMKEALGSSGTSVPHWIDVVLIPAVVVLVWLGISQLKKVKRPTGH